MPINICSPRTRVRQRTFQGTGMMTGSDHVTQTVEGLPGGSMFPRFQKNFPCVPLIPKSIFSILVFPVP